MAKWRSQRGPRGPRSIQSCSSFYPATDRFLCMFVCLFISFFVCFFVCEITRKRLDRCAWNFQGRCGVTRDDLITFFGQFRKTARCRDAQHGAGFVALSHHSLLGLPPKIWEGQKKSKIRRDFWQLSTLIPNISGTDLHIEHLEITWSITTPSTLDKRNLVNFGPQTKKF